MNVNLALGFEFEFEFEFVFFFFPTLGCLILNPCRRVKRRWDEIYVGNEYLIGSSFGWFLH